MLYCYSVRTIASFGNLIWVDKVNRRPYILETILEGSDIGQLLQVTLRTDNDMAGTVVAHGNSDKLCPHHGLLFINNDLCMFR